MRRKIHININDPASIDNAIQEMLDYAKWLKSKADELAKKLANYGADVAAVGYYAVSYDGKRDIDVTVEERGQNKYVIVASGHPVLIVEFGAGVTYGYGHPQASEKGFGPGTYPGQTHAMTGKGWWFTNENGESEHTYGNPPSMTMYRTAKELRSELERIAKEVFST